jgi:hypothetical protein
MNLQQARDSRSRPCHLWKWAAADKPLPEVSQGVRIHAKSNGLRAPRQLCLIRIVGRRRPYAFTPLKVDDAASLVGVGLMPLSAGIAQTIDSVPFGPAR